jgi:pyrroline-5-carboxylate reductase
MCEYRSHMQQPTIAFIGAGNMARALVSGLVGSGYESNKIVIANPSKEKLQYFSESLSVRTTSDNIEAAQQADVIVYAVKPHKVRLISEQLCEVVMQNQSLVLSVAAGVTIGSISQWLKYTGPIVRAMPNTPASIGEGCTGLFANTAVSDEQRILVERIFGSIGVFAWLPKESLLNAITAVSGSSPAYIFYIMEAMQKAAITMGLDGNTASLFIAQSVLGTAKLALTQDNQFAKLREAVTSPQGTTQAALDVFKQQQLEKTIADGMQAAADRAEELAETP